MTERPFGYIMFGDTGVTKWSQVIPISRQVAIDNGIIEPNAEERAQAERDRDRWARRDVAEAVYHEAVRRAVTSCDDPKLAALCDLHGPRQQDYYPNTVCDGCPGDCENGQPEWPCATALLLGELLGVREPSEATYGYYRDEATR